MTTETMISKLLIRHAVSFIPAMIAVALCWLGPPTTARAAPADEAQSPDYSKRVAPILRKYCVGCHNADDLESGLALDSYAGILKGGERGAAVTPKHSELSRLTRVLTGEAKPAMPPEDNEGPNPAEIAVLKAWIDAGAGGPEGAEPDPTILATPSIEPTAPVREAINEIAVSPDGLALAIARYGRVTLRTLLGQPTDRHLAALRGNVNAVVFSPDSRYLVTAAGEAGLFGEAQIWNLADGKLLRVVQGHKDSLYAVDVSPDGQLLATAGYDQTIKIWDVATGRELQTLNGHNGAVFDLAFRPDGRILASASADRTVKLWNVADGSRLETLGQSLKGLNSVVFHPDGTRLAAGGIDNRIRVWRVSATGKEGTNPLVYARFAHKGPILRLAYSPDGRTLVSTGEDRLIKIWDAQTLSLRSILEEQSDWVPALAFAPSNKALLVGRLDGTIGSYPIGPSSRATDDTIGPLRPDAQIARHGEQSTLPAEDRKADEVEPNDTPRQATSIQVPVTVSGRIDAADRQQRADVDLYRFDAKAGQPWIVETNAARTGSPVDTKLEVLHADGRPVERMLLRAVRDSEITFRPINPDAPDCRVTNWQEMGLNQYLYFGGEVVKLFRMPRGPDSGLQFYSRAGKRRSYFDTSGRAHALFEPCYIVEPFAPGAVLGDNGLPVFTLAYENDDDGDRKLGSDSRLTFTAPADGTYLIRVSDVRGFSGEDFAYQLIVRRPRPDFKIKLDGANPTISAGSGKRFTVSAQREDSFSGPIRVDITGLPPGFAATTPVIIQAGHLTAQGIVNALSWAEQPTEANWSHTKVTATATIAGREVTKEVNSLGRIKLSGRPKITVHLSPDLPGDSANQPANSPKRTWQVLDPQSFTAQSGATLKKLEDHSILASGENPDAESYSVVAETDARAIRAVRLEAIGDESFPTGAPGRLDGSGNFVLAELLVTAAPKNDPERAVPVKLHEAHADYSQPGSPASAAIDGDATTGWSVAVPDEKKEKDEKKQRPVARHGDDPSHWIAFELAEPVGFEGGTTFTFTLQQAGPSSKHNLGRFRLSLSTEQRVAPPLVFPDVPDIYVAPGTTVTAKLRVDRNGFEDRISFNVNNLPHGVIVDNIGLSGVLIPAGQTERTIYLTAADWVPPVSRLLHAVAKADGDQGSLSLRLHVRPVDSVARAKASR